MLTREENELITRTGPGTPMGELFRRFWIPVLVDTELPQPDCPPVRVRLLGEDLVAFRATDGSIGLLGAWCPHRLADLFFGRNEDNGLRCVYHGWKFDAAGDCVDLPNAPEGTNFRERVKHVAYPARERGGLIWAYLGPPECMPPLPEMGWTETPRGHMTVQRTLTFGNYLQQLEGNMDSSHVSFLHSSIDPAALAARQRGRQATAPYMYLDKAPRWEIMKDTDYGLMLGAVRNAEADSHYVRINQFLLPCSVKIATRPGSPISHHWATPVDDEHTMYFLLIWHPERPLTEAELDAYWNSGFLFQKVDPRTQIPLANRDNDYLIDREDQRLRSYTGIRSGRAQDQAVQEIQGTPIMDRSRERLVSADEALIHARRRLLRAARDLLEGQEPAEALNAAAYAIRPLDFVVENGRDIEEAAVPYMTSQLPWVSA